MVQVKRAFRSPSGSGTLQYGFVISTSAYDGVGRRITKVVSNSGDLDMTYHFYYEGQSIAEIRDGSDLVLKQHMWAGLASGGGAGGGGYIDELLQTTANRDLFNNPSMDIPYPWGSGPWADPLKAALYDSLHDANYNIQGLIEDATEGGNLAERYEYTPYGQRLVLRSSGGNDPLCHAPIFVSQRQASYIWTAVDPPELWAVPQPFGLNEFGHQGLYHDEETAPGAGAGATLIYNRARMLHTRLGRFTQRDPLGYVDGMSVYKYAKNRPNSVRDFDGRVAVADDAALLLGSILLADSVAGTGITVTAGGVIVPATVAASGTAGAGAAGGVAAGLTGPAVLVLAVGVGGAYAIDAYVKGEGLITEWVRQHDLNGKVETALATSNQVWARLKQAEAKGRASVSRRRKICESDGGRLFFRYSANPSWMGRYISPDFYFWAEDAIRSLALPTSAPIYNGANPRAQHTDVSAACLRPCEYGINPTAKHATLSNSLPHFPNVIRTVAPDFGQPGGGSETLSWIEPPVKYGPYRLFSYGGVEEKLTALRKAILYN